MRAAINDASDLVRHRRKVPPTHLDSWKVAKIGSLPYTLMDPLIPCRSCIQVLVGAIVEVKLQC
jgi:cohesin complex subunit SCC1